MITNYYECSIVTFLLHELAELLIFVNVVLLNHILEVLAFVFCGFNESVFRIHRMPVNMLRVVIAAQIDKKYIRLKQTLKIKGRFYIGRITEINMKQPFI